MRMRFVLPRVHGQWPGTIRGAEPTAGSSFGVGNYVTDKNTLTRPRPRHQPPCHSRSRQAPVSSNGAAQNAETMKVLGNACTLPKAGIEADTRGSTPERRLAERQARSAPLRCGRVESVLCT